MRLRREKVSLLNQRAGKTLLENCWTNTLRFFSDTWQAGPWDASRAFLWSSGWSDDMKGIRSTREMVANRRDSLLSRARFVYPHSHASLKFRLTADHRSCFAVCFGP